MRLAFFRSMIVRAGQSIGSRRGTAFLFGMIAGCYAVAWCHQLTAVIGLSLTTVTAIAVTVALGFELAWRKPRSLQPGEEIPVGMLAFLCLIPAAWTVGFDWLMELASGVIGQFSVETLSVPASRLLLSLGIAFVALTLPVYAITRLPLQLTRLWNRRPDDAKSTNDCRAIFVPFLFGIVASIVATVLAVAPLVGLRAVSFSAVICSLGLFLLASKNSSLAVKESLQTATPSSQSGRDRLGTMLASLWTSGIVICLGMTTAIAMRMTQQLLPAAGYVVWMEWAGIVAAAALGLSFSSRSKHADQKSGFSKKPDFAMTALFTAGWCALLPLLFSWHVSNLLLINSYVTPVSMQLLLRSLIALTMVAPIGFVWGLLAIPPQRGDSTAAQFPQFSLTSFVTGLLAVRWIFLPRWPIANMLPVIAMTLVAAAGIYLAATRQLPRRRLTRLTAASLLCLVAVSPFLPQNYNPARAARLLFSTQVFLAKRNGMQGRLLPYLDEGRLVAQKEGQHGTYTVWKMRGVQFQLREGGIPKTVVSNDTRICPQSSADVLQAALPILLHQQPRRTLVLGLQAGTTLDTCIHFPLEDVVCAESDPELIRLVKDVMLSPEKRDLFNSQRVKFLPIDPALALLADDAPYDVVISCPDQSALAQSTPYFTREFYLNAADRLAEDGIFCQRFQHIDFGPEPLRTVTATMQQAFKTVTIVETANGELALLGTNSPQGLVRKGLLSRLQANHVRNVLAQVGWDWVMPLNLTAYGQESIAAFVAESKPAANTAANGLFTFELPQEVMRWGAKVQEINAALAGRTESFLQWIGKDQSPGNMARSNPPFDVLDDQLNNDGDTRDVLLRLEELAGRRNLIARYPDEKWAYRKELRDRMKTKSRTIIEHVKGEGPVRKLHPDDKRRQAYLRALGKAVKKPDVDGIRRIAEFAHPYDPFVSFFLHDEIARIYDRSKLSNPAEELRHRLHIVYFTAPQDRSVRNIVSALNLLANHPEAIPNAIDRRDHMDGLLQMLQQRWRGRGTDLSISKNVALNDVSESVAAMTNAFAVIEQIYADNNLSSEDWKARRRVLQRELLGPLRTYRTRLLAQGRAPKRGPSDTSANAN